MGNVKVTGTLTGSISVPGSLSGKISVMKGTNAEAYTGDYEVVPQASGEQILPTANKVLSQDIVIAEIPFFETTNNSNGTTVYIANTL